MRLGRRESPREAVFLSWRLPGAGRRDCGPRGLGSLGQSSAGKPGRICLLPHCPTSARLLRWLASPCSSGRASWQPSGLQVSGGERHVAWAPNSSCCGAVCRSRCSVPIRGGCSSDSWDGTGGLGPQGHGRLGDESWCVKMWDSTILLSMFAPDSAPRSLLRS